LLTSATAPVMLKTQRTTPRQGSRLQSQVTIFPRVTLSSIGLSKLLRSVVPMLSQAEYPSSSHPTDNALKESVVYVRKQNANASA